MLGGVDRFILTPVRKEVHQRSRRCCCVGSPCFSVGGSVVFRNFELNLEEIVKDLPCTTVRAFARQLNIKIPWTKLATEPIEVVLDTVECVFAEGKPTSSVFEARDGGKPASTQHTSASPGSAAEGDGGWMGSLLERALTNVTVRVSNIVCKYAGSGAALIFSCQSAEIFSAGSNWDKTFLLLEDGLRKRCLIRNISVALDNLTAEGKVDAYQDPLFRTSSFDLRCAFASPQKANTQRCLLDARLAAWEANVGEQQLQYLFKMIAGFRLRATQGGNVEKVAHAGQIPELTITKVSGVNANKGGNNGWFDSSSDESDEEDSSQSPGNAGRITSAGTSMLGWAWNFLAEEDFGATDMGSSDVKEAALRELGSTAGVFHLNNTREWLIQCSFRSGKVIVRSDYSLGRLPSVDTASSPAQTSLPHSLPVSPSSSLKPNCSTLVGTATFETCEMVILADTEGLQAFTFRLNAFIIQQPPGKYCSVGDDPIVAVRSLAKETGIAGTSKSVDSDFDLSAKFMSGVPFNGNQIFSRCTNSTLYSETQNFELNQGREAVQLFMWENHSEMNLFTGSQDETHDRKAIHVGVGEAQLRYCPGVLEEWVEWLTRICKAYGQDNSGHIKGSHKQDAKLKQMEKSEVTSNRSSKSHLGDFSENDSCSTSEETFLQKHSPFQLTYFQITLDRISIALLSGEPAGPDLAVVFKAGPFRCYLCHPGTTRIVPLNGFASLKNATPALLLSILSIEIGASKNHDKIVLYWNIVLPFSVQASVKQGGFTSFHGLKGLMLDLDIQNLNYRLCGNSCYAVTKLLSRLVLKHNVHLPPISTYEGSWLGGQICEFSAKIGHKQDCYDLKVESLILEVFESRFELLSTNESAGPIIDGVDTPIPGFFYSSQENSTSKTIQMGLLRVHLTNQTLIIVQAIHALNVSVMGVRNSKAQTSHSGVVVSKESTTVESYQLMVAKTDIVLIALTRTFYEQSFTERQSISWEGQSGLQLRLTYLNISGLLGRNCTGPHISLYGAVIQVEILLGYMELCRLQPESCSRLGQSYKLKSVGEHVARISNIHSSYDQAYGPSSITLENQCTNNQASREKQLTLKLDVLDTLVEVSREHHIIFYKFAMNFGSISSPIDTLPQRGVDEDEQNIDVLPEVVMKCITIQMTQATLKLDLWRDDDSPSLMKGTDNISKLICNIQGGTLTISTEAIKKQNLTPKDTISKDETDTVKCNSEVKDEHRLSVASFELLTCRTTVAAKDYEETSSSAEAAVKYTFPVIRPGMPKSVSGGGLVGATWSLSSQGVKNLTIELSPLNWFIDSQLIDEIMTTCWERRKHIKPVAGVDVLPVTLDLRIVAHAGCLNLVTKFDVRPTPALNLRSEYFVAILDSMLGADARQLAGVHDGQRPGVMSFGKLQVQNVDVSLVNWNVEVFDSTLSSLATVVTPTDLRIVGKFLGCPGPIFLSCVSQNFVVNYCTARVSAAAAVLRELLSGWSSSWSLRQLYSSPPNATDDLRSGLFQISITNHQRLARGEIALFDGNANGGSISWRYPYQRKIVEILISERLFQEVPGLPEDTAVIFQLCFIDETTGAFMDAAPHLVAIEGESKYRIEPFMKVKAEEWRLSWFLPPGALPTTPPNSKARLFPATTILKLLQVNPATTDRPPQGDISALVPFVRIDLKAESVRLSLVQGREDTEVAAVQGSDFQTACHFWTSGLYIVTTKGILSAEYTDMATYTHELFMEPASIFVELSSCCMGVAEGFHLNRDLVTRGRQVGPQEFRPPPTVLGYSIWLQTLGSLALRLQKSFVQEAAGISELLSSTVSPSMDLPLESEYNKLHHFGFTLENLCPVNFAVRQAGSQELVEVKAHDSHPYAWRIPPKLSPAAERKLQVCYSVESNPVNIKGSLVSEENWWCDPIEVELGHPQQRQLILDSTTSIRVVVQTQQAHAKGKRVVIRPSFQLTNKTSVTLQVEIRGIFPSKFLVAFSHLIPGASFKSNREDKTSSSFSEGELSFLLTPTKPMNQAIDVMFATQLVRHAGEQATMRVLVEGDKGWSAWVPLEETSASTKLLLKHDAVDWKRGGLIPPSSPLLCLEHVKPDNNHNGQMGVVFWPLFYLENNLFRPLSLQVGLQGSDVVFCELEHGKEAPIGVMLSGREYLVAKVGTSLESVSRVESENRALNGLFEIPSEGTARQASKTTNNVKAHIKNEEESYKSKPILLTASIFRVGARFDISYQELPPVGSHDVLVFSSLKTGHSGFSCMLRTKLYKEGIPTILLSFVPMAVLHNHHFVPITVRDAWLPPESIAATLALPGRKAAFALQGLPGQQSGRKLCLGIRVRDLGQESGEDSDVQGQEDLEEECMHISWRWSIPLEVDTNSIQEVIVDNGLRSTNFLVRTRITGYDVEDENDACMCCHLAVYPMILVSNYSGHTLRFAFDTVCGSSFQDFADRSKLSPLEAPGSVETECRQAFVQIGILVQQPNCQEDIVFDKGGRKLMCNEGRLVSERAKLRVQRSGDGVLEEIHQVPQVAADSYVWSETIDLFKPVHQHGLMMSYGDDKWHALLLTCSIAVVDKQYHILVQKDPQPPCIVINDTGFLVEVRGVNGDPKVLRVGSHAKLDLDPKWLNRSESTGVVDLDEMFLAHRKVEKQASSIRIRVVGHAWSEPLNLTSKMSLTYVGSLNGSLILSMKVEQLGPTFYFHISPHGEAEALCHNGSKNVIDFTNITIDADIEKLRLSVLDDELRSLRGPDISGRSKVGGITNGRAERDEVCAITFDKIMCSGSQSLKQSFLHGVPAVSLKRLTVSLSRLQVDMLLEDSQLPVLITTGRLSPAAGSQDLTQDLGGRVTSSILFELCEKVDDIGLPKQAWLEDLQVSLLPLIVNIDNASFALARRMGTIFSQGSLVASSSTETGKEVGDAPDHFDQILNLEPQFYVGNLQIDRIKLMMTIKIARPILLNTHQAPVIMASFRVMESHFPLVVLIRGIIAHYTTQIVINIPGVLGSMDLLLNITGLVKGIQAGVNDLLKLPVRGIPRGPHGFLLGLGAGGFSLARHISVWTFTSIAGFASTLSQVLDTTYTDTPVTIAGGNSFAKGFISFGQGVARGMSGIVLTPMRAANRGRTSFFVGVGKGLVGAVAGPVSGALQLVAHTSQGLIGTVGAPTGSVGLIDTMDEQDIADTRQKLPTLYRTRSSRLRFERQILKGTLERYVGHTEVASLVCTSGIENSPAALEKPVLLVSDKNIRALENGGTLETAIICLSGVDIDEDPLTRTLTIYGAEGASFISKDNQMMCQLNEGLQLYVKLEEAAWSLWLPLLREAVSRQKSSGSR